jgi:hypothetical protein
VTQYFVPVLERIPWLQFMLSGEQNHPLAVQLIPLVTLWPLLAQFQHTVSPTRMLTVFGTKARPCPTVTSANCGRISHGVGRWRGVGVGLAVAGDEPINTKAMTAAAMTSDKQRTVRGRSDTNVRFDFVTDSQGCSDLSQRHLCQKTR